MRAVQEKAVRGGARLEIVIKMADGTKYEFTKVEATSKEINRSLNTNRFIRFGNISLNTGHIVSIEEK